MKVLSVRNVHEALPLAIYELMLHGAYSNSRNGPVLRYPTPVSTVYAHPLENVLFHPERDANPFFHLYESLWMLAGRNDVTPLLRYAKNMANYSDDNITLNGAYGYRWRTHFGRDQLAGIVEALTRNPFDRRCVLQMWDATADLGSHSKDVPCNLTATVQLCPRAKLDLTVFCRSNDIIWGCYGANAVHFSMLLEYLATKLNLEVGTYTQISTNWHAYLSVLSSELKELGKRTVEDHISMVNPYVDSVQSRLVYHIPMAGHLVDADLHELLMHADNGFRMPPVGSSRWFKMIYAVLRAHFVYKETKSVDTALKQLDFVDPLLSSADWVVAARQWLSRRRKNA